MRRTRLTTTAEIIGVGQAFLESAPDAIVIVDPEGRMVVANRLAEEMFGYGREELVGQPVELLVPERLRSLHVQQRLDYTQHPRTRPMGHGQGLMGRRRDGSEFPAEISLSPLETAQGRLVISIIRDVTERKRAEEEIRSALREKEMLLKENGDLEQRVRERTAALQAANEELAAFAYSVSHDLRAPLRGIHGYVHLLEEELGDRLETEGSRLLGVVKGESLRMTRLIEDLLRFSRLGRQRVRKTSVDLVELAQVVFTQATSMVDGPRPQLELDALPQVSGDATLLRQVLANLIDNAIKFSRHSETPLIQIGGWSDSHEIVCYVKDNGVGFDPGFSHKLFTVFQRLHSEDEFEGTGIGLTLVQRIIRRHGGRVWAEGQPNAGATFYFSLPATSSPTE